MNKSRPFRSPAILLGIILLVLLDTGILIWAFSRVTSQQASVRHSYTTIDQIAVLTSRLRDAEIEARRYVAQVNLSSSDMVASYHVVERQSILTSTLIEDQMSLALLKSFDEIVHERVNRLLHYKSISRDLTKSAAMELAAGDDTYSQLAMILSKMKEIQESGLNQNLAPASQMVSVFYLAAILTAVLNLFVGLLSFRQSESARKLAEEEANAAELRSVVANEQNAAAQAVSGELGYVEFGSTLKDFILSRFGASAMKVYSNQDGRVADLNSDPRINAYEEKNSSPSGLSQNLTVSSTSEANSVPRTIADAIKLQKTLQIKDVPGHFWKISSGLGAAAPTSLLVLPMKFQNRVVGVLEIASFSEFSQSVIERLESLASIFAASLSAAQSRVRAHALLQQTMEQAAELQAQQEELQASNEELEQQSRALESQQEMLEVRNKELESTRGDLERKAADLTTSSRYKSDFLAKMSHELRTPLNGLLILSTLLTENKEKTLTQQQLHFARSINSAGHDLLTLINDILDLSKIEARKLTLHPTEFTLGEVFASKRRTFEPQTAAKNLDLKDDVAPELLSLRLSTDRQRVDQVLRNFLSNAVKFTEKGSVTLKATVDEAHQLIKFTVIDTGIGIPQNRQKLIFDAFEQADASVSSKYGGTGLGLTISRELAGLLGGDIEIKSEEGKGSEFSLTIPMRVEAHENESKVLPRSKIAKTLNSPSLETQVVETAPEAVQVDAIRSFVAGLSKGKKSILIVEDDETFRVAVADTVKAYGFEAVEVGDGGVAIQLLETFVPDAILLDIKLPGISGMGILELIKQSPRLRHVPVHMISGMDYQTNALRMGALGYLTKPVTLEKVRSALGRIENLLSRRIRRLLLIEDNKIQSDAVSALITGSDIEVVPAATGREALEKVKSGEFDCIVLDLSLPDVSGFDFLAELRGLQISLPPVVIYTGRELSAEEQEYLSSHAESIIIKGARSPERLLDEVNLFLHRVESTLPENQRNLISALRSSSQSFNGRTVLIADDDIRNIFALTSALEAKGMTVVVARDGQQALDQLAKHSKIDLVLMDIMMPKMDGIEAIKRIRASQDRRIKSLPIVAVTAKAMRDDYESCMQAGANDYLPKPINLENLMTIIKVWLGNNDPKKFV